MTAQLLTIAIGRPNALDREVTALSPQTLLASAPASLLDPARAAAAVHLEQFRTPVWIVMVVLQIGVLAWFWNSGYSARLRDYLRLRIGSEFFVRFCFGAALGLVDRLAAFVPQAVTYRYLRIMDLNELLFRTWLAQWVGGTIVAMILAGLIACTVLWLADRTHQWYLYTIAGVIGLTLLLSYVNPFVFAPVYTRYEAIVLPVQFVKDVQTLERRTGVAVPVIEAHVSPATRTGQAYVTGWGGTQRIVISDTMLAGATEPELRYVVARSLAWVSSNSGLHQALIQGAFVVLGTAIAVFISDRIGFRRDDDPVSRLALLGAVMGCVFLIALPFYNGYSRNVDLSVENTAILLTRDPVSAIRLEVREADQGLATACPSPFAYWYFSPHPTVGQSISLLQQRPNVCAMQRL